MENRSYVPDAEHITYVCDVEGHWDYFCSFVALSEGVRFAAGNGRQARCGSKDLELELADGWHFVFGGDTSDKGPGTLRFQEAMVRLKRRYPDRVHLLMGNRDINKMGITAELAESEVEHLKFLPATRRSNGKWRLGGREFLQKVAAKELGIGEGEVTDAMVDRCCTKASKLRYMLKYKMNSEEDFEFRRDELALTKKVPRGEVKDEEVARSYENNLGPGGWTREYLRHAQIGVLIGSTLFVHGQIIGNSFTPGKTRGADDTGTAWCIGVVPGIERRVDDAHEWLSSLNVWARNQVEEWEKRPTWDLPPAATEKRSRGGADLMDYASASSALPTVVYCRWLTESNMPLPYPPELSEYLRQQGIQYVVVGHTPHGNAPTVIQNQGVITVMGDTSFSDMNTKQPAYAGDMRGSAACDISFGGGTCGVKGRTESGYIIDYRVAPGDGDRYVGSIQEGDPPEQRFFVKARLPPAPGSPEESYIMCNIQGFKYQYAVLNMEQLRTNLTQVGVNVVTRMGLSGCGRLGGIDETFLERMFEGMVKDKNNEVSKSELAAACTVDVVREALLMGFPDMSLEQIFQEFDTDRSGSISLEEFRGGLGNHRVCARALEQTGVYFEVVGDGDGGAAAADGAEFPCSLGPFESVPTRGLQPSDLQVVEGFADAGGQHGCECALGPEAFRTAALGRFRAEGASMRGYLSPPHSVNLPEAARRAQNIPEAAAHFAWSYPFLSDWALGATAEQGVAAKDPDWSFLTLGGFVYFDSQFRVVQMNAIMQSPSGGLRFGPPRKWQPAWTAGLRHAKRWRPVTLRKLLVAGALEFCWLKPDEFVRGSSDGEGLSTGRFGAFAYLGTLDA